MKTNLPSIGDNIRYFRTAKNWTIVKLAEKIGVQQGPLGRIERGYNAPSARVLYSLSKALGVSIDMFFYEDTKKLSLPMANPEGPELVTGIPKEAPMTVELSLACKDLMRACWDLEKTCNITRYSQIPLSAPFKITHTGMEELACQIRKSFGIDDVIVYDYSTIMEDRGLRVFSFRFPASSKDIETVTFMEPTYNNAFFFINSRIDLNRWSSLLVRELGKVLIWNQMYLRNKVNIFCSNETEVGRKELITVPDAVDKFVTAFMLPEKLLRRVVTQAGIRNDKWTWFLHSRICHKFRVEPHILLPRLRKLELIDDNNFGFMKSKLNEGGKKRLAIGTEDFFSNRRLLNLYWSAIALNQLSKENHLTEKTLKRYKIIAN